MAKFQVFVRANVEVRVEASSIAEAERIAEEEWYEALNHSGDFEIEDIYQYED